MWNALGQAATVAQLVGVDIGGLISMIIQAAATAEQNKKECEQLARRVFTVGELLQHVQDPEVLRRPEIRRALAELDGALHEAHELVMACQDKSVVYRLVMRGRQTDKFRDVQSKIDSYLLLFPVISHIDITHRLDRIYNILLSTNDTAGSSSSTHAFTMPQITVHYSEVAPKIDWKKHREVQQFAFNELAKATNNFAPDKKIGCGGFGLVYKGWLPDGRELAIKRMTQDSRQGIESFLPKVTILPSISHKHIVRLFGYCALQEKKRQLLPMFWKNNKKREYMLVYEFMENRSLDFHLYELSSPVTTSWKMRIEILLGVSRAIEYLQSYAEQPVIHRDITVSNILLDASWAPRLTDFGLALSWEGPGHEDVVVGTMGYVAPEYMFTGTVNPTIDIYSFGIVMLEVLTGRRTYSFIEELEKIQICEKEKKREDCEEEQHKRDKWKEKGEERAKKDNIPFVQGSLVEFTMPLIEADELRKVLDNRPTVKPTLRQLEATKLVAQAAVRCLQLQPEARPPISEVVATLEMALELARSDG